MTFVSLFDNPIDLMNWSWSHVEPYYQELLDRTISSSTVETFLLDWTELRKLVDETYARLQLSSSQNTADEDIERRYHNFLDNVYPLIQSADYKLKQKLLESGLEPEGFAISLRNMHSESDLFREANLPLMAAEHKLGSRYNKIIGAQTVRWDGQNLTLSQLRSRANTPDRCGRARVWQLVAHRQIEDRESINANWVQLMEVRRQLAENAGFPNYREYRWRQLLRFDYTPEDCKQFHQAIERIVVPVATRIYEKHRHRQGLESLRPWDLDLDLYPIQLPVIHAYHDVCDLEEKAETIFRQVHPVLGEYFTVMRQEGLLDLENRMHKGPGAFCTSFATQKRPFVFMNAVGLASDVRTLLHECGHAFHVFERTALPYHQQWRTGMEFAEVASMSMELLANPYLSLNQGGFYLENDAARANVQHLEKILLFWPYMAVVDAFQHWVYENHDLGSDPANCDAKWAELRQRFIPGVDWSGLEPEMVTGWQRKLHIHRYPFYYIEYGLAQVGAVQVWRNALNDQASAVDAYRQALALGGTASLPELYRAAGANFSFDERAMREAVELIEEKIEALEGRSPTTHLLPQA